MTSHSNTEQEELTTGFLTTYERGSRNRMKKPLTEVWGLVTSDADVEKLKIGLKARNMDDRWEILVEDLDVKGNLSIHIASYRKSATHFTLVQKQATMITGERISKASPGK